jgi:hypothetical protein
MFLQILSKLEDIGMPSDSIRTWMTQIMITRDWPNDQLSIVTCPEHDFKEICTQYIIMKVLPLGHTNFSLITRDLVRLNCLSFFQKTRGDRGSRINIQATRPVFSLRVSHLASYISASPIFPKKDQVLPLASSYPSCQTVRENETTWHFLTGVQPLCPPVNPSPAEHSSALTMSTNFCPCASRLHSSKKKDNLLLALRMRSFYSRDLSGGQSNSSTRG